MPFAAGLATAELFLEAANIAASAAGAKNANKYISFLVDAFEEMESKKLAARKGNLRGTISPYLVKQKALEDSKATRQANINNLRGPPSIPENMVVDEG